MQIKMSVIIPQPINVSAMKQEFITAMKDIGVEIRENFEDTVRTWNHKPTFEPATMVPRVGVDTITVETLTDDLIYKYVSEGTKTKPGINIVPVRAKKLAFPGTFIPKTFPGIVGSGAGFSGPVDTFRAGVHHPGVKARNFVDEIQKRQEKNAKIILTNTISLVRKASGHAFP